MDRSRSAPVYRGRFAPSPTGPLHLGSLTAALASYLDAKSNQGQWLVRIEDVDPLREAPGASDSILHTLEAHGLFWDEAVSYQSERSKRYEATLQQLYASRHLYPCPCSRKALTANQGKHPAHCRDLRGRISPGEQTALRFAIDQRHYQWCDTLQGMQSFTLTPELDDFVLKRKEGFYAYQLAVVCDDLAEQITDVIRGYDLIDSTPMQLALYQALCVPPPRFGHVPVILANNGQKLSKQNHAPALQNDEQTLNLTQAITALGMNLPSELLQAPPEDLLNWAIANWSPTKLQHVTQITEASLSPSA